MIITDKQRRWWFAHHPELGESRSGNNGRSEKEETRPVSPILTRPIGKLTYDSKTGRFTVGDDRGSVIASFAANSGKPGITDPSLKGQGPIPPGWWILDQDDISPTNFIRNWFGDWGEYRVRLYPVGTKTFGRTDVFLHGGKVPGSLGCIDVGTNDRPLSELFMQQEWALKQFNRPNIPIILEVK